MIYVMGTIGFFLGFAIGQMVIFFMLRHKDRKDLLNDRFLKYTYGLANWGFAGAGAYLMIILYQQYF